MVVYYIALALPCLPRPVAAGGVRIVAPSYLEMPFGPVVARVDMLGDVSTTNTTIMVLLLL